MENLINIHQSSLSSSSSSFVLVVVVVKAELKMKKNNHYVHREIIIIFLFKVFNICTLTRPRKILFSKISLFFRVLRELLWVSDFSFSLFFFCHHFSFCLTLNFLLFFSTLFMFCIIGFTFGFG